MSFNFDDIPANRLHGQQVLYDLRPDYTRTQLEIPAEVSQDLHEHMEILYGPKEAKQWLPELERILKVHHAHKPPEMLAQEAAGDPECIFDEQDMIVITYGDMIKQDGEIPLRVLMHICNEYFKAPNSLHILPFFPYSSDRGFSVVDFVSVDPKLGDWSDIRALAGSYKLMFDGVVNHVSSASQYFQDFMDGRPGAEDYFVAYDSPRDLTEDQRSKIFRPRTSDILSPFDTLKGRKYLWTTFSADQIDLNYRNPEVLLAITEALLLYVRMGADLLRLDAVTYLWAEIGTECVHLPETHQIIKLLRTVMDTAAPGTALITETNVPHEDNVSYFGNGRDEAHMVYNFALPPMVLYSFFSGEATELTRWARVLDPPSKQTHFFNMLDTHDGIGVMGVRGILQPEQIKFIVETARANGALVSYKTVEGGGQEPYEINTTWWSVLNPPHSPDSDEMQVRRHVASRSIQYMLKGVPGVYMHGILASENDWDTYRRTLHARDLNRAYIDAGALEHSLRHPNPKNRLLINLMLPMNISRVNHAAFHPRGRQKVLELHRRVFSLLRISPDGQERILCLTNVSQESCTLTASAAQLGKAGTWRDVLNGASFPADAKGLSLELEPYQVLWLAHRD